MKISKKGKSIKSDDIRDLIYWNKYRAVPFIKKIEFDMPVHGALSGTYSVAHEMPYIPLVKARVQTVGCIFEGVFPDITERDLRATTPIETSLVARTSSPFPSNWSVGAGVAGGTQESYSLTIDRYNITVNWAVEGVGFLGSGYIDEEWTREVEAWVFGVALGDRFDSDDYKA